MSRDPLDVSGVVSPAVVAPPAAFLILRDAPEVLRVLRSKAAVFADRQPALAHELAVSAEVLRRAADAYASATGIGISEPGSTEVPRQGASPHWRAHESVGVDTKEAAEVLGISGRQVINLIRNEKLVASFGQGRWCIDRVSLAAERERRGVRNG